MTPPAKHHSVSRRKLRQLFAELQQTLDRSLPGRKLRKLRPVPREIAKTVKLARTIRKSFDASGYPLSKKQDRIIIDLADIEEISRVFPKQLRRLLRRAKDKELLQSNLQAIYNELYLHLDYHLKRMKKPLEAYLESLDRRRSVVRRGSRRK